MEIIVAVCFLGSVKLLTFLKLDYPLPSFGFEICMFQKENEFERID